MNNRLFLLIPALFLILTVSGCKMFERENDQLIAECYGHFLYRHDLDGIVQPGTSADDSIAAVKQFIDSWIRQQIMLQQAENNLTDEQKDFSDQIEQYRNSLIIFAYESELIRQKLDTIVTDIQIEEFYNANQASFMLLENIVRVRYIKIPEVAAKPDLLRKAEKLIKSGDPDDDEQLIDLCQNSLLTCFIDDENWIRFDDLLREIPIKTDNQEEFLRNRSFYQTKDSAYTYLVRFRDVKTKEGFSPLSYERNKIRELILNRRKIELMDKMQQQVFQEALSNKEFTIY